MLTSSIRLMALIIADLSILTWVGVNEAIITPEIVGVFEQSGKLGLQAIAIAGLVIVWRKLEKIERKRDTEWKAREAEWKANNASMFAAINKVTEDLRISITHHDEFAKLAQQERADAARLAADYAAREEKQFNALIKANNDWQELILRVHKEARATLQANTSVGRALILTLRSKNALPEVTGHDAEFDDEKLIN